MFDPTVFDNLKVVLEGAVYDLDLEGWIEVKSRSDLVNLADMSRSWSISFQENRLLPSETAAEIHLSIVADQLQAEWKKTAAHAGCNLQISFTRHVESDESHIKTLTSIREIWGEDASIEMELSFDPFADNHQFKQKTFLFFNRLITEEHAGDLESLVESVFETLKRINAEKGAGK